MSEPYRLTARYVFPVASPPLAGGVVTVCDGRIVDVSPAASAARADCDLGNAALVPGLVNAHTHLEFSDLPAPLGRPRAPFPDWIGEVVRYRQDRSERGEPDPAATVCRGLDELLRGGSAAVGEIATPAWQPEPFESACPPVEATVFLELIGLAESDAAWLMEQAAGHIAAGRRGEGGTAEQDAAAEGDPPPGQSKPAGMWRAGISPHAPYSVRFELIEPLAELSRRERVPLAMHLAESVDEMELLASHSGALVELLSQWGVWDPTAVPRGVRPLNYLERLARAFRAALVHGTFLDAEETALLAKHRCRLTLVHCPRTHDRLCGGTFDLAGLLAAGVRVALGTDSRASNPDLSMLDELRFAADQHPDVPAEELLRAATLSGAYALAAEGEIGSLEPGKRANMAVIGLPDQDAADPHRLLFDSAEPVREVYCRGTPLFDRRVTRPDKADPE